MWEYFCSLVFNYFPQCSAPQKTWELHFSPRGLWSKLEEMDTNCYFIPIPLIHGKKWRVALSNTTSVIDCGVLHSHGILSIYIIIITMLGQWFTNILNWHHSWPIGPLAAAPHLGYYPIHCKGQCVFHADFTGPLRWFPQLPESQCSYFGNQLS